MHSPPIGLLEDMTNDAGCTDLRKRIVSYATLQMVNDRIKLGDPDVLKSLEEYEASDKSTAARATAFNETVYQVWDTSNDSRAVYTYT